MEKINSEADWPDIGYYIEPTHPVNCSVKPMINGPKSQRTFSIIIKLISFGRNHYQKSEKSVSHISPESRLDESGHWHQCVRVEKCLFHFRNDPRRHAVEKTFTSRIQTQFLSVPDTFSRYPNIYLKLNFLLKCCHRLPAQTQRVCSSLSTSTFITTTFITSSHRRRQKTIKRDTGASQAAQAGLTFVCSLQNSSRHTRGQENIFGRLGKWRK